MKNTGHLTRNFAKTLIREKVLLVLVVVLPIMLVFAGASSAPDRNIPLILDDTAINPFPPAIEISVALYAITAVVLIASIVSFFLGFNIKHLIPRLRQVNYSNYEITLSFVLVMFLINIIVASLIALFSLIWIDVTYITGYMLGLILSSVIFSTLGLIIAELVDTTTLGLYTILSLAILDTAFLENPIYSRRYNEDWISIMPSHESIQLVLRAIYDTGTHWTSNIWFILLYELILIIFYVLVSTSKFGFKNNR